MPPGGILQTSHSSVWSGVYPAVHNVRMAGVGGVWKLDQRFPLIATKLAEAGMFTTGVTGNGFVTEDSGYARGFKQYRNMMREKGIINGIIYGRRGWRPFFIGGTIAGLGPHLGAVYYTGMVAVQLLDGSGWAELLEGDRLTNLMIAGVRTTEPFSDPEIANRILALKAYFGIQTHALDPLLAGEHPGDGGRCDNNAAPAPPIVPSPPSPGSAS